MRVIDLAKRTGVSGHTIRYYTRCGLLKPSKDNSGYHRYNQEDISRLGIIRYLRDLSLPLEKIEELLGLAENGGLPLDVICACLQAEYQREQEEIEERLDIMQRINQAMESGHNLERKKNLSLEEFAALFAGVRFD